MKEKKALIISFSKLDTDPRVLRQIDFIGKDFLIHTAGISASRHQFELSHQQITSEFRINFRASPTIIGRWIRLAYRTPIYLFNWARNYITLVLLKNYEQNYWTYHKKQILKGLSQERFDLIVANDIESLPLAIKLKSQPYTKVYFDAHEFSPLEYENDVQWLKRKAPYLTYLCKQYISSADYCTTVAYRIADEYNKLTGKSFDVIYNCPPSQDLEIAAVCSEKIRCVHHGVASPMRRIESMIKAFIQLGDSYELNLLLMINDIGYYNELILMTEGYNNIIFHHPKPTQEIPKFINQFDVSLIFIPPINFNYRYCLPNKFFESIQARLMLICGPSEEMESLIEKYDIGVVSNGFDSADIVESLLNTDRAKINRYKQNTGPAAKALKAEKIMGELTQKLVTLCAE